MNAQHAHTFWEAREAPPVFSSGSLPALYLLPPLPHLRLRFTLEAQAAARLPGYEGSMLRGGFGHALRRLACVMGPRQACAGCSLCGACAYSRVFETFVFGPPPPFLGGLRTSPRPFVIEPHGRWRCGPSRELPAGGHLGFDLLLFGRAAELLPFAVLAVERMAERGLGARRYPFRLRRVEAEGEAGRFGELPWSPGEPWRAVAPPRLPSPTPLPPDRLLLRFATPTRLLSQGELQRRVRFRPLAFRILRRHLELAHFYGDPAAVDWTFAPLLRRASEVEVVESALTWQDWERYSNRQQAKVQMGGFVGHLVLTGDLAPFTELLRSAEVLHVGKGTTLGLGKVEIAQG